MDKVKKRQSSKTPAGVSEADKSQLKQKDLMESTFHRVYIVPPTEFEPCGGLNIRFACICHLSFI